MFLFWKEERHLKEWDEEIKNKKARLFIFRNEQLRETEE